ncbi:MAG TPA: type II toxin-antitoxin system VapC family toxin [Anaerolineales bacterium]|nr:type II toxin-antitoxin system VapC family toxin [Anaerolineales bacterium]
MNVIDSSGWLEYLTDGANADYFTVPILDEEHLLIPTLDIYEVFKRVLVQFGNERALEAVGSMSAGEIIDVDRQIAIEGALLSAELKLAIADSLILATARAYDATLWTQDAHFKGMPGVQYIEKKA